MRTNKAIRTQILGLLTASYNDYMQYVDQFGIDSNITKNQRAYYTGLRDAAETMYNCPIGIKKDGTNIFIPIERN